MQLIKKIEINYLRSLYSLTVTNAGDLNLIFGRNDSGKSNLLRALNLFFNGSTDPGREFDFNLDMSDPRKSEAREAKGRQFIWIRLTFKVPTNYRGSLGKEISVKKQWNREGILTESVSPALDSAGKQARLTRFLNDIDFTYIPAIKDLNVYADLIERVYGAAAETEEIKQATTGFINAIGGQTSALTNELTGIFGSPTRLAPPTEMERLFRNLDFAHGDEGHSLLRQKGDGVKARHLPEILRFINENEARKKLFLWGFEEPENSLDLGAAETEANRFASFAARTDTQVFVTSHSPAFYLAQASLGVELSRIFIRKQTKIGDGPMSPKNAASQIDRLDDAEKYMEDAGLLQLPFVIRKMSAQNEELNARKEEATRLRKKLEELTKPTLFVEGKHDVSIFRKAIARSTADENISVKQLGGTPSTTESLFNAVIKQGGINSAAPTLFLFDNDKAGRNAHRKLCKLPAATKPIEHEENVFVWVLRQTDSFSEFTSKFGIAENQSFFTAEFMFPAEQAAKLAVELTKGRNDQNTRNWRQTIHGDYWNSLPQTTVLRLLAAEEASPEWLYARGVPDAIKAQFDQEAAKKGLNTDHIDAVTRVVCELLNP